MSELSGGVTVEDFRKLCVRVVEVRPFPEGRTSTQALAIDYGPERGSRISLARLAPNDEGGEIVGRLVLAAVDLPPRQIGMQRSEVPTPGEPDAESHLGRVRPDADDPPGGRLYRRGGPGIP